MLIHMDQQSSQLMKYLLNFSFSMRVNELKLDFCSKPHAVSNRFFCRWISWCQSTLHSFAGYWRFQRKHLLFSTNNGKERHSIWWWWWTSSDAMLFYENYKHEWCSHAEGQDVMFFLLSKINMRLQCLSMHRTSCCRIDEIVCERYFRWEHFCSGKVIGMTNKTVNRIIEWK